MTSKHSIMLGTDMEGPGGNDAGQTKFITPSAHRLASGTGELTELQAAAMLDAVEDGFDSAPSAAASSNSGAVRPPSAWQPRRMAASSGAPVAAPAPKGVKPELASDMTSLSAALAQILAGDKAEQDSKEVEHSLRQVQAGRVAQEDTMNHLDPSAATATCFDLITSTAARVPLSAIIAAGQSEMPSASGAAPSSETYVVLQPVDWTIHHANCTFARLTGINRGADAVDEIALELAEERSQLQTHVETITQQLASKDRVIEQQRQQIKRLEAQLAAAHGGSAIAAPEAATSNQASASSPARSSAPAVAAAKVHDSESESDEDDMADAEDGDFGRDDASQQHAATFSSAQTSTTRGF